MPYERVEPDIFLEFAGVAVYHCYDDNGELCWYWYTTDPSDDNRDRSKVDGAQFDVRDLPDLGLDANDLKNHGAVIQQAIRAGLTTGEPAIKVEPLVVKIKIQDGVAEVVERPPGIEVEIVTVAPQEEQRNPCDADLSNPPTIALLQEWEAEGGCEATDGCWVEPDGRCEHGCPSWLLVMGLI